MKKPKCQVPGCKNPQKYSCACELRVCSMHKREHPCPEGKQDHCYDLVFDEWGNVILIGEKP
jgi:hypothetical protein